MAENWVFGFAPNMNHALAPLSIPRSALPPFPLVSSASFGSARSSPGREAAKRTLDGEDRSDTMKARGERGVHNPKRRLTEGVSIDDYSTWRAVRFAERDEDG